MSCHIPYTPPTKHTHTHMCWLISLFDWSSKCSCISLGRPPPPSFSRGNYLRVAPGESRIMPAPPFLELQQLAKGAQEYKEGPLIPSLSHSLSLYCFLFHTLLNHVLAFSTFVFVSFFTIFVCLCFSSSIFEVKCPFGA